jgi:hypothetical protein
MASLSKLFTSYRQGARAATDLIALHNLIVKTIFFTTASYKAKNPTKIMTPF